MEDIRIWIASDHGGYETKRSITGSFGEKGYMFNDVGCHSEDICRYPHYASLVCEAVASAKAHRGILICSTGIGMSIFANKYNGVRASLCTSSYMAKMTRLHNDANVLCLGGRITGIFEIMDIVDIWLNGAYEGGRHDISLGMIREAEAAMINGAPWLSGDARV